MRRTPLTDKEIITITPSPLAHLGEEAPTEFVEAGFAVEMERKARHLVAILERAEMHYMDAPRNQSSGEAESRRRFHDEIKEATLYFANAELSSEGARNL